MATYVTIFMGSIGMAYYYATIWGAERDAQEWFPKTDMAAAKDHNCFDRRGARTKAVFILLVRAAAY
ncbi:MAG: hypothetical protein WAR76_19705 [Xanthobacteraceae bacterium]|jgi:hypothetical protein